MKQTALLYFALATSIASLGVALLSQYGFGLRPCELCQLQRIPYGIVILLSLLALRKISARRFFIPLIILSYICGSALAFYHASVEKHWIAGPSGCTVSAEPAEQSLDDFLQKIQHAPIVACDQPAWEFHSITMAAMNGVWSLFLAGIIYAATQQFWRQRHA